MKNLKTVYMALYYLVFNGSHAALLTVAIATLGGLTMNYYLRGTAIAPDADILRQFAQAQYALGMLLVAKSLNYVALLILGILFFDRRLSIKSNLAHLNRLVTTFGFLGSVILIALACGLLTMAFCEYNGIKIISILGSTLTSLILPIGIVQLVPLFKEI